MIAHEREIANRETSTAAGPKPSNFALLAPLDIPDGRATSRRVTSSRHTVSAGAMPMAISVAVRLMVAAVLQMRVPGRFMKFYTLRPAGRGRPFGQNR